MVKEEKSLVRYLMWRYLILIIAALVIVLAFWIYSKNSQYISLAEEVASGGIAANYDNLPRIVPKLPGTKVLFSAKDYRLLKGNEPISGIYRNRDKIVANLYYVNKEDDADKRSALVIYDLPQETNLANTILFAAVQNGDNIGGKGHQRSRIQIELRDFQGKAMRGPKTPVGIKNITNLFLRPSITEPIPTGSFQKGFDMTRVRQVAIRFIIARYPDGISTLPIRSTLSFNGIYLITDMDMVTNNFRKPDSRRVTKDNIIVAYELRKLKWSTESSPFFVGIDYPWNNYGWDIGKNPYARPENTGWSTHEDKLQKDFTLFKESGITTVRIYIFFDFRTGLVYGPNGALKEFDQYVRRDIETVFKVAGHTGIKIIPVLFDFGIADGQDSEHPELIFFNEKFNFLIYFVKPLLKDMDTWNNKYGNPVFAVELMNEPDNMAMLIIPGYFQALKNWFTDLINIIHNETSFKITLGSNSIVDMQRWWSDLKIDIWQFHYYKNMAEEDDHWPLNLKRSDIKLPGIIICGELEPYDIGKNLDTIKANGYNGALFWSWNSTDGFRLAGSKNMDEITDWIKANKN